MADERYGEVPRAVCTLRPGASATPDELVAHCSERLARYKVPRRVELRDELPLTLHRQGPAAQAHRGGPGALKAARPFAPGPERAARPSRVSRSRWARASATAKVRWAGSRSAGHRARETS